MVGGSEGGRGMAPAATPLYRTPPPPSPPPSSKLSTLPQILDPLPLLPLPRPLALPRVLLLLLLPESYGGWDEELGVRQGQGLGPALTVDLAPALVLTLALALALVRSPVGTTAQRLHWSPPPPPHPQPWHCHLSHY